jgi:hypothetical protein
VGARAGPVGAGRGGRIAEDGGRGFLSSRAPVRVWATTVLFGKNPAEWQAMPVVQIDDYATTSPSKCSEPAERTAWLVRLGFVTR